MNSTLYIYNKVKKTAAFALLCMLSPLASQAQSVALKTEGLEPDYVATITKRAQKIVDGMAIFDAEKALTVRNIIANRYFLLNGIHEQYDKEMKFAKDSLQGKERDKARQQAATKRDAELYKHHFELEGALSLYVDADGIDMVKNGMTYDVVNVTYKAYCDMIPSLKDHEKSQIMAWLKEAREFAMDAGKSNDKHGWFKKYKGRINNWLSAQGYDIQKEREAWMKRIEEKKSKK